MPYFVYLLECRDQSLYCGYTSDLGKRVAAHNAGRGGRYTRTHLPVKLVYSEKARTRLQAMRREREIKGYSRKKKQALIEEKRK
ncbi:MAG TPA: GIY-YIG nuclease family protein [Candidatus Diapherotrites archaeon]|uniref:GIY-YIG nuclease family protein n=1 Tax=Candidatus Iainarchaeum sp. TaxID=3101447 RepID=A0A7J4JDN5_9ARCH|nr:GIY-YIG nuclease family protein [Candidatus Diapherotrites archaeon]HIH15871.1 GIY-YIG nuclease family protein [Candidatus Diapherotrites archaeon]